MEFKTPYIIDDMEKSSYIESDDGRVCCYYDVIPHYYVAVVESKDRTLVEKHCCIFNNLEEIHEYINSLL